jgi:hypothetical protein
VGVPETIGPDSESEGGLLGADETHDLERAVSGRESVRQAAKPNKKHKGVVRGPENYLRIAKKSECEEEERGRLPR